MSEEDSEADYIARHVELTFRASCEDEDSNDDDRQLALVHLRCPNACVQGRGTMLWRASTWVGRWLVSSPEVIRNQGVLEIGAGLGAAGLMALALGARRVILTDVVDVVLENLRKIQGLYGDDCGRDGDDRLSVAAFDFCEHDRSCSTSRFARIWDEERKHGGIQILLCCDVLYENEKVRGVMRTINEFFFLGGTLAIVWNADGSPLCNRSSQVEEVAEGLRRLGIKACAFWNDDAETRSGGSSVLVCWNGDGECPVENPLLSAKRISVQYKEVRREYASQALASIDFDALD